MGGGGGAGRSLLPQHTQPILTNTTNKIYGMLYNERCYGAGQWGDAQEDKRVGMEVLGMIHKRHPS